jgi:hypothetical protein
VRGRLNPAFRPGDPLIVRRAPAVTRDALVIDADVAAADLPRSLVAELAREGARIAVWIQELVDEPAPAVLVVDIVPGTGRSGAVTAALREARAAIAAAHEAGHTVLPHPDLPPSDAVLAVAGIAAAGATEIDARTQRPRDVEWDAIDCALVSNVPADRLDKWLRRAERAGASRGVIGLDVGTPREQFIPWKPGEQIDIPGARGRTAALALIVGPQSGERTPDTSSVSRPEPRTSR